MIETFIALLLAHALADFVFQTGWIHANKRRPGAMLLHGLIVLVTAQAALGQVAAPELAVLAVAHLVIDVVKTHGRFTGPGAFLADQAALLVTLVAVAGWAPGLWAGGFHATQLPGPVAMLLAQIAALGAGLILALRAGRFWVQTLMEAHAAQAPPTRADHDADHGLPRGGQTIGHLERLLIFVLTLTGQPAAIGFLVAAKSILRFGTVHEDRRASEYVIIGTLASFGWAIVVAQATRGLLTLLPGLEIGPLLS